MHSGIGERIRLIDDNNNFFHAGELQPDVVPKFLQADGGDGRIVPASITNIKKETFMNSKPPHLAQLVFLNEANGVNEVLEARLISGAVAKIQNVVARTEEDFRGRLHERKREAVVT